MSLLIRTVKIVLPGSLSLREGWGSPNSDLTMSFIRKVSPKSKLNSYSLLGMDVVIPFPTCSALPLSNYLLWLHPAVPGGRHKSNAATADESACLIWHFYTGCPSWENPPIFSRAWYWHNEGTSFGLLRLCLCLLLNSNQLYLNDEKDYSTGNSTKTCT